VSLPLRHCGGFLMSLESKNAKGQKLDFDFGNSKNLKIEPGPGVELDGSRARVTIKSKQIIDPFVTLVSIQQGAGILLKYAVSNKDA